MLRLHRDVRILRDRWGIPHVEAESSTDAWWGLGFAAAEDRLPQMEQDRRRAVGRWAEIAGATALPADRLARRLRLELVSRADVDAMSDRTRATFEAYAAGVNAYLDLGGVPPELAAAGCDPEPWEAWHSVAAYRVRHAFMGTWPVKLVQAELLATIGAEAYATLDPRSPVGVPIALPPGARVPELIARAADEFASAAAELGWLATGTGGSNAWALAGSRTASGRPILCCDPHRECDFPNVYWQAAVRCPEFDVTGATFPGLPGFPNFGLNAHVAWSVTHGMADTQDLFIERFDAFDPTRYQVPDGWRRASVNVEVIRVKGAPDEAVETWMTRHGPIVHGDPRSGFALALASTATASPNAGFDVLEPMLRAQSVDELIESQRGWVDPVNNFVCADQTSIAYVLRGQLPVRASRRHRELPAAGWTDDNEWTGTVPFDEMPRLKDPPTGFIASANQPVIGREPPYVAHAFAEPYRAERIIELLRDADEFDLDSASAMQLDTLSTAARRWVRFLRGQVGLGGVAEDARGMLAGWDGQIGSEGAAPLLYAIFRQEVVRALFEPVVGGDTWVWLTNGATSAKDVVIGRWFSNIVSRLDAGAQPPSGARWSEILEDALGAAWARAVSIAGEDTGGWAWGRSHQLSRIGFPRPVASGPGLALPEHVPLPGDGDTIRVASYGFGDREFTVGLVSVYRQIVDMDDATKATWVIPGGAGGDAASGHLLDQLPLWARGERVPMNPDPHAPGWIHETVATVARH